MINRKITEDDIKDLYNTARVYVPELNNEVLEYMRDCALEKFNIDYIKTAKVCAEKKTIIDYLNKSTGKEFRLTTAKTKNLIKARMNEGFVVDDFKKVIDNKVHDWLHDKDMNKFLRPETLFGSKFESYLNQQKIKNNVPGYERRSSYD